MRRLARLKRKETPTKTSLFPITTQKPDGGVLVIVNELCTCGHFRTQHHSFSGPTPLQGHGSCGVPACTCGQFTWKTQLFGGVSTTSDMILASIGPAMHKSGWYEELETELENLESERDSLVKETQKLKGRLRDEEKVASEEKARRLDLEVRIGELAEKIKKMTVSLSAINIGNRSLLLDE